MFRKAKKHFSVLPACWLAIPITPVIFVVYSRTPPPAGAIFRSPSGPRMCKPEVTRENEHCNALQAPTCVMKPHRGRSGSVWGAPGRRGTHTKSSRRHAGCAPGACIRPSGLCLSGGGGGGGGPEGAPGKYQKGPGGGGVWDPEFCVPKMARSDFSNGKCRVSLRWSLWCGGAGGYPPLPPAVYSHSNTSLGIPPPNTQHMERKLKQNPGAEGRGWGLTHQGHGKRGP